MKNILSLLLVLVLSIFCSACMNNYAVSKLIDSAKESLDQGDVQAAISSLKSAIELDGDIYEARYDLAVIYSLTNKCEESLEQADYAETLKPQEPAVNYLQAISNCCIADKLFKDNTLESGEIESIDAAKKYITYLNNANIAFEKYLSHMDASDKVNEITEKINFNNTKINKYSAKFGITL